MTDEERAENIRKLAKALNQAMYDAHTVGLLVALDTERREFVGSPQPLISIRVDIYREIRKKL